MVENFIWNEVQRNISHILPLTVIFVIIIGFLIVFFASVFKDCYEKYLDKQLVQNEIEHSLRLIEALYSERHDYQNCLQVLKLMTASGSTEKIDKYLSDVIKQMINSSGFTQIDNPVLAASIVSHQVKAKEYNILIKVNCSTSLKGIANISVRLGKLFDLFLDLIIENMTSLKGSGNEIVITIEERAGEYSFDFKADSLIDAPTISASSAFGDKLASRADKARCLQEMDKLKGKIKELKGDFYYVVKGNHILRLKLTINQQKENNMRARVFQNNEAISF